MEQYALGHGARRQQEIYTGCPGAMADHSDVGRITAEYCDVLLQPMKRCYLVHKAVISRRAQVRVCVGVQESCIK